ncbi:hypothetical protein [Sedimentisphaera salicampi]|uniref:Uncharacterized protein n=1 Tax=Sedimentisphaera salicampi TaxID=1941349 RepID=A0A1W6LP37_9BACT|nr:hypothetical protein [Sedimentisphaera salicampi]ARN57539.1 hypothetical protein STSP1_01950 [Sedimentisphaera salicampi]OXU14401.1 hypothetical protein SMSP1_01865 [Sedimentisphaera salicampi]
MKKILTAIIAITFIGSAATAAELKMNHIPADSKWVFHWNSDRFSETEYWEMGKGDIPADKMEEIEWLSDFLGYDVLEQTHGVTLYGPDSKKQNAVLMVYGEFDKPHVISQLEENEEYELELYRSERIHQWRDQKDNRLKSGIFASPKQVVVSENRKALKKFIDMKAKDRESLKTAGSSSLGSLLEAANDDAFMIIGITEISNLDKFGKKNAIFNNSSMLAVVSGEKEGKTYIDLDLTTKDKKSAKQVEKMISGIKAFLMLKSKNNTDALSILEKTTLTRDKNQLFMSIEIPSEKVYKAIKRHAEKEKAEDSDK